MPVNPATDTYAFPSLTVDVPLLLSIERNLRANGCTYKMGAKASPLTLQTNQIHALDCSGFVRYALYRTAGVIPPDGSVQQHDWAKARGFKHSSVESAKLSDGAVRIAFLAPEDGGGVGHVVLVHGGETVESHGGTGPDRRAWTGTGWQGKCDVFVLMPPA